MVKKLLFIGYSKEKPIFTWVCKLIREGFTFIISVLFYHTCNRNTSILNQLHIAFNVDPLVRHQSFRAWLIHVVILPDYVFSSLFPLFFCSFISLTHCFFFPCTSFYFLYSYNLISMCTYNFISSAQPSGICFMNIPMHLCTVQCS